MALLLAGVMAGSMLTACGSSSSEEKKKRILLQTKRKQMKVRILLKQTKVILTSLLQDRVSPGRILALVTGKTTWNRSLKSLKMRPARK